jgi:serralysin
MLKGFGGDDILAGDGDDDELYGMGGNDTLYGGNDNDTLSGGADVDRLLGGAGADVFAWSATTETGVTIPAMDAIADFNFAQGDRIDLRGVDADVYAAGNQAFDFIGTDAFSGDPGEINYFHSGGNTIIQLQTGTSADIEGGIVLEGLHTPEASWFLL